MKIARFSHSDGIRFGIVDEGDLVVLAGDPMFAGFDTTGERVPLADAALLAPVIPRSKVVCVGRNYHEHAAEFGNVAPEEPLLFLKPNTSVIGPGDAILRPAISERTEFEGELVVVIGRIAKNVKAEDALDYVFGYTVGNDFTARDIQRKEMESGVFSFSKAIDTFCPIGPYIVTADEIDDPHDLDMELRVNGDVRQKSNTSRMSVSIPQLVAYHSPQTYSAGDLITTGTIAGVAASTEDPFAHYLKPGDVVEAEIEHLGVLRNRVVSWQDAYGTPEPPAGQWA